MVRPRMIYELFRVSEASGVLELCYTQLERKNIITKVLRQTPAAMRGDQGTLRDAEARGVSTAASLEHRTLNFTVVVA